MRIKNIEELKKRKAELKEELSEIESVLSFKDPRRSIDAMSEGATEKYLGRILDSKLVNKTLPLATKLLGASLKVGTAKFLTNVVKKKMTSSVIKKGIIGLGTIAIASFLAKKAKNRIDNYQRKQTAKSINKLI